MRKLIALALLALPAAAPAEGKTIAEAAAITRGIDAAQLSRARTLFAEALRETGIEVIGAGQEGTRAAEFVASLSLAEVQGELILVGQISRFRLDRWSARSEMRLKQPTQEALAAAVQEVAGQLVLAARTAPPRDEAQPDTRPPARRLRPGDLAGERQGVEPQP